MIETPPANPPPSLGFLIGDVARLMRRRFDQRARASGLSRAQWQALFHIAREEGSKQAHLAECLDVEPITLTRLLDRMEEGGWVERRPDPGDRRARLLYLTDKARPALGEMRQLAEEIYEEALAGLTPEARAALVAALGHMRANLCERSAEERAERPAKRNVAP
ncbi:MarR family winged helix-turn-helix transcriptional regulator [Azospirillum sp. ST 5-10]|uniref:MarR family winged helix-turn-helix transcriptional regulator n=1 Tax=unclassified Azospirillum TaxID=2630922 RepID=UPI003F4A4823